MSFVAGVVIDASVWVDFLSGVKTPSVEDALADDSAIIPPLVVAELVTGALTPAMREAVGELLQEAWVHETSLEHWIDVGTLRRLLGRKGINATLPDAHVAQCALDLDAFLLTRDKIFADIAKHTPLRLAR